MPTTILGADGVEWEIIIGMEVHAQVISNSKLFSGASTAFGSAPNHNVSLIDAAMPGMLPVLNEECVRQAVRTGLGLKAQINKYSVFDRKNYFYADLPQGYQISQLYHPIVGEGSLTIELADGSTKEIGIERLHLEQDAGKSIHDQDPDRSFIDLNRTGVALMEIVSKPDIRGPEEAAAYMSKLRTILRYLGTCDGNMQEGSMRADVNVSVRKVGEIDYRTRTETKNMNSLKFIQQAILAEAQRQITIYEDGGTVDQETRLFNPDTGLGRSMRSKEEAHDYRYFPDPDLLPLQLSDEFVSDLEANLPELPDAKQARFQRDLSLSLYDAGQLVMEREKANFFEQVVAQGVPAKPAANWVLGDYSAGLKERESEWGAGSVDAISLSGLVRLVLDDTISNRAAKDVLAEMWETGKEAELIVDEKGLRQVSDTGALEKIIDSLVSSNPDQVEKAKENPKLIGWFVGQVMKESGGKANPGLVNKLLSARLS
ncbi:MAG: Asp-tRNA(Asn)/Glu-tRNA(Gln) amidotransferase subunit GatB [Alphaproteobacteria bacterium]